MDYNIIPSLNQLAKPKYTTIEHIEQHHPQLLQQPRPESEQLLALEDSPQPASQKRLFAPTVQL